MFRRKSQRQPKQQDPFSRINAWDDGYEYIRDKPPSPPEGYPPAPFYSPPMPSHEAPRSRPQRHQEYNPYDFYPKDEPARRSYPSPPSSSDRDRHHRRRRRRSPSPPPYRSTRSPSPPPRRRDYDSSRTPLSRSKSMRDPPRGRDYSPPRHRQRSPSPVLPGGRLHNRPGDRRRAYSPSLSRSPSPPRHRRRSPSPRRPTTKSKSTERPNLSRSKTTSAKDRFSGLSPRWQAAAAAALQAGSMAALNARSQPGAWAGEKGARVATAALGAAAMNAFQKEERERERAGDRKKGGSSKRGSSKGRSRRNSGVEALGGVLGGFLMDQLGKKGRR